MGLLDPEFWQSPQGVGLLSGAASYMANAQRGRPVNSIGRGLAGGLAGYGLAQDQIRQAEQDKINNELRQFQLQQARDAMAAAQKTRDWRAKLPEMMKPVTTPEQATFEQPPMLDSGFTPLGQGVPMLSAGGAMTGYKPATTAPNPALRDFLMADGSPFADKVIEQQLFPKEQEWDTTPRYDQQGRAFVTSKTGQIKYLDGITERGDPNKPFRYGPNGEVVPNQAYQNYEYTKAAKGAARSVVNPALDPFKNEQSLRKEYQDNPLVKSAAEMTNAFRTIEAAYQRPSPANDLAMATKYMKILDPTSVVRESEFALAVNATGVMDKVYNYANMIKTGQKLNPAQRQDFYNSAKAINEAFQAEAGKVKNTYRGIAKQYNLNPDNATLGPEFKPTEKPAAGLTPAEQKELEQLRERFKTKGSKNE